MPVFFSHIWYAVRRASAISTSQNCLNQRLGILCGAAATRNNDKNSFVSQRWSDLFLSQPAEEQARGLESVLLCHYLAGLPKCIEALRQAHDVGVKPDAINLLRERNRAGSPCMGQWWSSFEAVYGAVAGRLQSQLDEYHPDFSAIVLSHPYGRVINTSILTINQIQLANVGGLSCLNAPRQVRRDKLICF